MESFMPVYIVGLLLMTIAFGAYISDKIPKEWFQR